MDAFTQIARRIRNAVGHTARRIDHIGSTAIPGLGTKDVLDTQITVSEPQGFARAPRCSTTSFTRSRRATGEWWGNAMQKHVGVFWLTLGLVVGVAVAEAQERSYRIGILGPPEEPRFAEMRDGLQHGLREQGYTEPAIEILAARVTRGDHEQVRTAVAGFLQQRIRVLVVIGSELAKLVREVSAELPIVYLTPGDPVEQGLAASLAHPGGQTTAMTFEYPDLAGKRLELLREMLPQVRRVLILYDPRDGSSRQGAGAAREAAPKLGLTLVERETYSRDDITRGLEALAEVDAFLVILGGLPTSHYADIIRTANAQRVPTMFHARTGSTMEALVSYGANDREIARQLARHVAKILTGVKAGDLPVERPMQLELVINLKVAQQIGVTIPSAVLMQANKVLR